MYLLNSDMVNLFKAVLVEKKIEWKSKCKCTKNICCEILKKNISSLEKIFAPYLYCVLSEQGLCARTMMNTCWNWDRMLGMKGRAPGSCENIMIIDKIIDKIIEI